MSDRIAELMELASTGDEDILLQVESEFALMPETRGQRLQRDIEIADAMAETYAPPAEILDETTIATLADDAGF